MLTNPLQSPYAPSVDPYEAFVEALHLKEP